MNREFRGETYESPFRVIDWHGEEVTPELDGVPPLLSQEETDALALFIEENLRNASGWRREQVVSALRKLPDTQHGRDQLPDVLTETTEADR